jgi:hypothetical protein
MTTTDEAHHQVSENVVLKKLEYSFNFFRLFYDFHMKRKAAKPEDSDSDGSDKYMEIGED